MRDIEFMELALVEARRAYELDEVPVGAVIVKDGAVVCAVFNRTRGLADPTAHAEMLAIREAASILKNERLTGCELFVTKEPCAMCAGAIVHARLARVVIAARDVRYGACGTALSVCGNSALNHVPEIVFDVCGGQSSELLKRFFAAKRVTPEPPVK